MIYPTPDTLEVGTSPHSLNITIHQGQVPNIGFRLKDQRLEPENNVVNLTGYGAVMHVRSRVNSDKIILELTHIKGLVLDELNGTVWLRPRIDVINSLPTGNAKREWVYDLILEQPTGGPVIVCSGGFTVMPVVTRVSFGRNLSDVPRLPNTLDVVVPGIQGPRGGQGPQGSFPVERIVTTAVLITTKPLVITDGKAILPSEPSGGVVVWNIALVYMDLTNDDFDLFGSLLNNRAYLIEEHLVTVICDVLYFSHPPPINGLHCVVSYIFNKRSSKYGILTEAGEVLTTENSAVIVY